MKNNFLLWTFGITSCIFSFGISQIQAQPNPFDLYGLSQAGKIVGQNRTVTTFSDEKFKGIKFSANEGDGVAWIEGINFSNGTIELDIRGKDVIQQSFVGVAFHGSTKDSLEAIYFRPFNFRSSDPVRKVHAVQYIFGPDFGWEKLRNEHPGVYEKGIDNPPSPNEWFHAKIVVNYPEIKVFVNNSTSPSLTVKELSANKNGKIGLWVGNNSDGFFANLVVTKQ